MHSHFAIKSMIVLSPKLSVEDKKEPAYYVRRLYYLKAENTKYFALYNLQNDFILYPQY